MTTPDPHDLQDDDETPQPAKGMAGGYLARTLRFHTFLSTRRFNDAEKEARRMLAEDPQNGHLHALLGHALYLQDKDHEAVTEAKHAIGLGPDDAFAHAVLGWASLSLDRYSDALAAVREALRLDPHDASYHALESAVHLARRKWEEGLTAANRGLRIRPEDHRLRNQRAIALRHLGRHEEADTTISGTLQREPDNAFTHANQGWGLLHAGQYAKAGEHFREALRLDPQMNYARDGLLEVLKARNPIYRVLLRWQLWMTTKSGGMQWGVMIGLYVGYQVLRSLERSHPELWPIIYPLVGLYIAFALLTWIGTPIFDATLMFSRFGRHALPPDRKRGALLTLSLMALVAIGGVTLWLSGSPLWITVMMMVFGLLLPGSRVFLMSAGWPRWVLAGMTLAMAGLTLAVAVHPRQTMNDVAGLLLLYLIIFFASWIAGNFLAGVQPKK